MHNPWGEIGELTTKIFAENLEDLIQAKKLEKVTIKQIAEGSGVPTGSISKYQNDVAEAGISSLVKLARYFGVSTDFLLGLSDIETYRKDIIITHKTTGMPQETIECIINFYMIGYGSYLDMILCNPLLGYALEQVANLDRAKLPDCVYSIIPYIEIVAGRSQSLPLSQPLLGDRNVITKLYSTQIKEMISMILDQLFEQINKTNDNRYDNNGIHSKTDD